MNILIQRMHAPPADPAQQAGGERPQLPPLNFNGEEHGAAEHRSALTTIREQSTMSTESHPTATQHQAGQTQQPMAYNGNDPGRNGNSGPPLAPSKSASPTPSGTYAPLTSAGFASSPEGNRSASSTPGQVPSPAPAGSFAGPSANTGSPNQRAWSPQAGGPTRPAMHANGSTGSFSAQNAPKLSLDTNSRTGSPLSVRNGAPMPTQNPATVNHQQLPSIPSLHTPSADATRFHQADASVTNPSHMNPSQQSTSYHTAPQVCLTLIFYCRQPSNRI